MKVKKFVKMKIRNSKGTWQKTDFSVREDGVLLNTYGKNENSPVFVGQDLIDAGLPMPKPDLSFEDYSETEQALALRIDHPRVELLDRDALENWLSGEEDEEKARMAKLNDRNNQNDFLKSKGYRWEKRSKYFGGEALEHWHLIDPDGNEVVGTRDAGNYVQEFGDIENILLHLGYYGQAALDAHNKRCAEQEKAATERSEARKIVDDYFENSEPHTPIPELEERSLTLISITKSSFDRTMYAITDDGIWKLIYNGMDGDNWSYNNYSMYIATRYDYDADIAKAIEFLKS